MNPTSVAHSTFTIENRYPASPEKVFSFFSDPAKKRRWLGGEDEGFEIVRYEPNFAVEAYDRWQFRFKGGDLISNDTCYQEIVPGRRIVFVYKMAFAGKPISASLVTVEFVPDGKGTKLVHTEQGAYFDGMDQAAGREAGTRGLLVTLGRVIAEEV